MRRFTTVLVLVILSASVAWGRSDDPIPAPTRSQGVTPGVILVQLKPGVEPLLGRPADAIPFTGFPVVDAASQSLRVTAFKKVFRGSKPPAQGSKLRDLSRFYRLEFDAVRDPAQVVAEVEKDPNVAHAEVIMWTAADQLIPNDPKFDSLWYHQDATDNDMDTPEAWTTQTGDPDVPIAIFDTGVLYTHLDLATQIWVNPGEDLDSDGVVFDPDDLNGVDDDGNGFIDDVIGWDFVASATACWPGEDCSVEDNDPKDYNGHGTHVAGITAAATNNQRDVAGVAGGHYPDARGARIMPLRIGWSANDGGVERGLTRMDYVAEALNYAVMMGARIGNLSYSTSGNAAMDAALVNAFANGFIFTKAAGNDNSGVPDAYDDFTGVLAVATTNSSDIKASFSDWGVWVDVSAPGVSILNTYSYHYTPGTAWLSGTSMAAPMVAGEAALILSNCPYLTKAQVDSIIINTTDNIDALNPSYAGLLGSGRVNAANALAGLPIAQFTSDVQQGTVPLAVQFTDLSPSSPTEWRWDFGDGDSSTTQNPLYTYTSTGIYDVRFDAITPTGTARRHKENYVLVHADTVWADNGKNCPGKLATVTINLTNALPVYWIELPLKWQGTPDSLVSYSFDSTRISYFEYKDMPFSSIPNKFSVFEMKANSGSGSAIPPLPPGSGPILKLTMKIGASAPTDTLLPIDTFSYLNYHYRAQTTHGIEYYPLFDQIGVNVLSYCRGDFNLDGAVTSADIIAMVGYVFKAGAGSADPWTMDVDVNGSVTSGDIIFLVNYVFKGGNAPQ